MAASGTVELPVRWDLSMGPGGSATLALIGELDAVSTPAAWRKLEGELKATKLVSLRIDVARVSSCDSAGLALLHQLSTGGMTPGVRIELVGLSPELQHLYQSFSSED